jgi:hypothetical protein
LVRPIRAELVPSTLDLGFALAQRFLARVHGVVPKNEIVGMLSRGSEHEARGSTATNSVGEPFAKSRAPAALRTASRITIFSNEKSRLCRPARAFAPKCRSKILHVGGLCLGGLLWSSFEPVAFLLVERIPELRAKTRRVGSEVAQGKPRSTRKFCPLS